MKKLYNKLLSFLNNRYLVLVILVLLVSTVYVIQLFNLQVINGKKYREKSEKRMLRTDNVIAARGEIYDRNGVVLATSKLSFDLEIYKIKVSIKEQNDAIYKLVKILQSNSDRIYSSFPVNEECTCFNFSNEEEEKKWKNEMKIDLSFDFNKTIDYYINKYEIKDFFDRKDQIQMIKIKYEGNLNGYSLFNSCIIAKDISQNSVAQIEENKSQLNGFNVVSVPKRYYPFSSIAAHTIGYVSRINSDEYKSKKNEGYTQNSVLGKAGVEETFEPYLKGKDGINKVEVDEKGNVASEIVTQEPLAGKSVTLTIDYRLQKVAEESLLKVITGLNNGKLIGKVISDANAGSVVVLDVNSGEVLAMANYPTYDINCFTSGISIVDWKNLNENPVKPMYNRAISGVYSPGSTYKMLVGLAGLNTGLIKVDEMYKDPGIYQYGYHPKCWMYTQYGMTHGWINISGAIKGSCNCFFYEVGRRIGIDQIVTYANKFGLGNKTGIELSAESKGQIAGEDKDTKDWYFGDTLAASIGQSYNSFTPIQLANYIATIANSGNLNKVTIIKNIKNESTLEDVSRSEIEKYSNEFTGVNFKENHIELEASHINAIKEGMYSVTNEIGGTANIIFKKSNIKVAGKTGTSQVTSGSSNGIFVGFAPYDNPKIAVVAIIEHGGEGTYTAQVVKPIMEEYFNISEEDRLNEREQNVVENIVKF
ncbi:MAG: penicillin-binding protein 2 [Clostridia bacterium]